MIVFDEEVIAILDETDQLADMIQASETYEQYATAKAKLENDATAQRLYQDFLKSKMKFDEVQRFGRYHPDYQEIMLKARRQKRAYEMHHTVIQYKQKETDLQALIDEVVLTIVSSVSEHIKVDVGVPFFKSDAGCGCNSGHECGCNINK